MQKCTFTLWSTIYILPDLTTHLYVYKNIYKTISDFTVMINKLHTACTY